MDAAGLRRGARCAGRALRLFGGQGQRQRFGPLPDREPRQGASTCCAQALIAPRFDEDAVDRVRAQVLSQACGRTSKDPGTIAGADASTRWPSATIPMPRAATAPSTASRALTRDDIVAAHQRALARDRMLRRRGRRHHGRGTGAAARHASGRSARHRARRLPGRAQWALDGGVTVVDFPSPQSVVLFGQPGIAPRRSRFLRGLHPERDSGRRPLHGAADGRGARKARADLWHRRPISRPWTTARMMLGQFSTANDKVAEAIEADPRRMGAHGRRRRHRTRNWPRPRPT